MDIARSRLQHSSHTATNTKQIHQQRSMLATILWSLAAIASWGMVGLLLFTVQPTTIANLFIPQSYLPLLLFVWCALFTTATVIVTRKTTALLAATLLTILLSLRIQQVVLTPILIASGCGVWLVLELAHSYANLIKKARSR